MQNKKDQAASAKKHYEANKDKLKARARAYSDSNRVKLRAYIKQVKSVPCTDCSVSYPSRVMEFDHVRGEAKIRCVASMVSQSVGLATLKTEIAKCDAVCANCHRLRHIDAE